ncbi:uncharacterized protein [Periplaneta americana]
MWGEFNRNRKWKYLQRRMKCFLRVVMDLMKMEPEDDPLEMDLIKMEPGDDSLDFKRDNIYKLEENKASSEDWNLSHLEETCMKTEYVDDSYEIKSEKTVKSEEVEVPTTFAFVKCEVDEDVFDVDRVQQEHKVEVSSKEDELFPER